jgi:hypothetical protein
MNAVDATEHYETSAHGELIHEHFHPPTHLRNPSNKTKLQTAPPPS